MSENSKKDNLKYALTYIPLVAFFFYFVEENKTEEFKKHIKYAIVLFLWYVIISIILWVLFLWWLKPILLIVYLVFSIVLWYKAYNWEEVEVDILDDIWDKLQEKIEWNNKWNNKKEL